MNQENEKPTSAEANEANNEMLRPFELHDQVHIIADGVNPVKLYEIVELKDVSGYVILRAVDDVSGENHLYAYPESSVQLASESVPHRRWKASKNEVSPLQVFEAISEKETDAIIADLQNESEPHSPEIEAELEEIIEDLGETAAKNTVEPIEENEVDEPSEEEEEEYVPLVGRPDAEVKKISVFDTSDEEAAEEIEVKIDEADEAEVEVAVAVEPEATEEQAPELHPVYLERVIEVKDEVRQSLQLASEKLDSRFNMDGELKRLYEGIVMDVEELRNLAKYEDHDAFRRDAHAIEEKLFNDGLAIKLFNNDSVYPLYEVREHVRKTVDEQKKFAGKYDDDYSHEFSHRTHEAENAVKDITEKAVPFTRDFMGPLGNVERKNQEAYQDLMNASSDLQAVISKSYEHGIDTHAIHNIIKQLERYKPDAGHNPRLFDDLRTALDRAATAIANASEV